MTCSQCKFFEPHTPLPQKVQRAILKAFIRHYHQMTARPRFAKMLIYAHDYFSDELIVSALRALMVHFGDWGSAVAELRKFPKERVSKLITWAAK